MPFSAGVSSYCFKLAVRVNVQVACAYLPTFFSTLLAFILSDLDNMNAVWSYTASYILALLPLLLLTTHLLTDSYGLYQLERDLFINLSFRPISTPIFSLLNRRILEHDDECLNIILQDAEEASSNTEDNIDEDQNRDESDYYRNCYRNSEDVQQTIQRARQFSTVSHNSFRSMRWFKGQEVPKIFICTTLWHEEDFEMATLIRSTLKLIRHAKLRKTYAEDNDYYDLEMHIFFDNVFDEKEKRQSKTSNDIFEEDELNRQWQENFAEWKILNRYVVQFHNELRKGLRLFHETDRFNVADSLKTGKVVITPYGGRVEYNIAGTPLVVHLKDADKVRDFQDLLQSMFYVILQRKYFFIKFESFLPSSIF